MSVFIVGKKSYIGQVNQKVFLQNNHVQNTLYINEHKFIKGNQSIGSIQMIRQESNSKVVTIGHNSAKEQKKFVYVNNKVQKDIEANQLTADIEQIEKQQNFSLQKSDQTNRQIHYKERISCQIIHNQQTMQEKQKQIEEQQKNIIEQKEQEQQLMREIEQARLTEQTRLLEEQAKFFEDAKKQEEVRKHEEFKQAQIAKVESARKDEALRKSEQIKKTEEIQKAKNLLEQKVEQMNKDRNLVNQQSVGDKNNQQHMLILQGQSKQRAKDFTIVQLPQDTNLDIIIEQKLSLHLKPDAQCKQYYSRPWQEKEDIRHWGQRKLILMEIYFLTTYGHLSKNILYAGAAPGIHIQYLSFLFKNHTFHLYDPNQFKIQPSDKILLYKQYFTLEESKLFHAKFNGDYLFISDVRAANFRELAPIDNEKQIQMENKQQMEWVETLKPKKSMLKFRCAYPSVLSEPTEFFEGDILIQPWAPQSSTETRLIPKDDLVKVTYDNKIYEEQMFFHNDVTRKEFFIEMKSNTEGLDGSWDACAEWMILSQYVKKFHPYQKNLEHTVFKFSRKITKKIQWENGTRQLSDKRKQSNNEIKILRI